MKKLLLIFAISGFFAACSNGNNDENTSSDTSRIVTQDTAQVVTDTTITHDTINNNH